MSTITVKKSGKAPLMIVEGGKEFVVLSKAHKPETLTEKARRNLARKAEEFPN